MPRPVLRALVGAALTSLVVLSPAAPADAATRTLWVVGDNPKDCGSLCFDRSPAYSRMTAGSTSVSDVSSVSYRVVDVRDGRVLRVTSKGVTQLIESGTTHTVSLPSGAQPVGLSETAGKLVYRRSVEVTSTSDPGDYDEQLWWQKYDGTARQKLASRVWSSPSGWSAAVPSPGGAYVFALFSTDAGGSIYRIRLSDRKLTKLTRSGSTVAHHYYLDGLAVSADGKQLFFGAQSDDPGIANMLIRLPSAGGTEKAIASSSSTFGSPEAAKGTSDIWFRLGRSVYRVPAAGGSKVAISGTPKPDRVTAVVVNET